MPKVMAAPSGAAVYNPSAAVRRKDHAGNQKEGAFRGLPLRKHEGRTAHRAVEQRCVKGEDDGSFEFVFAVCEQRCES